MKVRGVGAHSAAVAITVALAFGATPAMAQGTTAHAAIGGLWLTIDSAMWDVRRSDADATITCTDKRCRGVVLDVTFAATDARCDETVAYDAARLAFPGLNGVGVNMVQVDQLAFFVAEAMPPGAFSLDWGRAVYACLDWNGTRYELRTRVDGPVPNGTGWVVRELLHAFYADPLPEVALPLGALELAFPGHLWEVRPTLGATEPRLDCLPPHCGGHVPLHIGIDKPANATGSCLPAEMTGEFTHAEVTRIPTADGRLALEFATIHSMCRAWTPPHFGACIIHDGVRYSFSTGWDAGCHFGPAISEAAFLGLVQSLRPVTP